MYKDFLKEWIEYGDSKSEPYRFVSYYIAFNFLYNDCSRLRRNLRGIETENEINQIYNFLDKWKKIIRIDPYRNIDIDSEYYIAPVESEKEPKKRVVINVGEKIFITFLMLFI